MRVRKGGNDREKKASRTVTFFSKYRIEKRSFTHSPCLEKNNWGRERGKGNLLDRAILPLLLGRSLSRGGGKTL